ncbi:hypothetical protein ACVBGC_07785 [Burkholderia stagnalis]
MIVGTGAQQAHAEQDRNPDGQARKRESMHVNKAFEEVAHCIGDRRDDRNETKWKGRFRESPMLAKCKVAPDENLTPLKCDRVNQHKTADYFLHRSSA